MLKRNQLPLCHCFACCNCKPNDVLDGKCNCQYRTSISVSSLDKGLRDFEQISNKCFLRKHQKLKKSKSATANDTSTIHITNVKPYHENVGMIQNGEGVESMTSSSNSSTNYEVLNSKMSPSKFINRIEVIYLFPNSFLMYF